MHAAVNSVIVFEREILAIEQALAAAKVEVSKRAVQTAEKDLNDAVSSQEIHV